jgi:hypothetical protein
MLLLDGSNANTPSLQLRRIYTSCFSMKLINANICRTTKHVFTRNMWHLLRNKLHFICLAESVCQQQRFCLSKRFRHIYCGMFAQRKKCGNNSRPLLGSGPSTTEECGFLRSPCRSLRTQQWIRYAIARNYYTATDERCFQCGPCRG